VLGSETWIYSIAQSRWEVSTGTTSTISISATGISCQPNIGTGAFALPIGTTAQRITPVRSGALRYNSSIGQVEAYYTNTGWTTDLGNTQTVYTVQYLGVGGGGGGGQAGPPFPAPGGNGGTGAVAQGFTSTIAGTSYTITVGSGGVANSVPAGPGINPGGGSGGTTSITGPGGYLLLALGGLGGTGGTGFGGAGVNGSDGTAPVGGSPSIATTAGIYSNITGASVLYGKRYPASPTSTYGTGGAGGPGGNNTLGTPGNSGVVVIKYVGAQRGIGGSVSPIGTYTIHTFTSPGTYVA
jgi:hypothetical protein